MLPNQMLRPSPSIASPRGRAFCFAAKWGNTAVAAGEKAAAIIEAAKDMLINTDRPVVNIAYDLSYSETNYFSKTFKKKVGVTPTEYREQHLNGQMMKIGG